MVWGWFTSSSGGGGYPNPTPFFYPYFVPSPSPTVPTSSHRLTPKLEPIKLSENNWVIWSRYVHAMIIELGVEYCLHHES